MPKLFFWLSNDRILRPLSIAVRGNARKALFAIAIALCFLSSASSVFANNTRVSKVGVVGQDADTDTAKIGFNISWDNSWRDSTNYDAAWVFAKYSTDSGSTWHHATLKTTGYDTGIGTAIEIIVPADGAGCFIQRSGTGSGTLSTGGIKLVWDYGANGVSDADARKNTTRVKVFAIEMVYIPEGGFQLGDGVSDGSFTSDFPYGSSTPCTVSGNGMEFQTVYEGERYTCPNSFCCYPWSTGYMNVPGGPILGYLAFYLMKYEISEGQWVGFFNMLTSTQKSARDITAASGKNSDSVVNRNTISWTSGNAKTTRPARACAYLSWDDLLAYADWAGLRPMTELEFEKSCGGGGGYAWSNNTLTAPAAGGISGAETGGETITTSGANALYNNISFTGVTETGTGPLRVGIFAAGGGGDRTAAGAGLYGNMDLSGNVWERAVALYDSQDVFDFGSHGDGVLSTAGDANDSNWSAITSGGWIITKGGGWASTNAGRLKISDRANGGSTGRGADSGGRCARTAP
jgi:formylglycine-generating enzyme required for sulfatase activity